MKYKQQLLVGFGYDCHKIVKNRELFLGGVKIDVPYGLKGHSDADVILHSICDAILSVTGLPDIGELFPNNVNKYKGLPSSEIVKKTLQLIKDKNFCISNIDITIICDRPKIVLYKNEIINSVKKLFNVKNVNIKGKTTEGIKCFKNYIQSYAVVLVVKNETI